MGLFSTLEEKEHIITAHQMADEIFSMKTEHHIPMFEAIAKRLAQNYRAQADRFVEFKRPTMET